MSHNSSTWTVARRRAPPSHSRQTSAPRAATVGADGANAGSRRSRFDVIYAAGRCHGFCSRALVGKAQGSKESRLGTEQAISDVELVHLLHETVRGGGAGRVVVQLQTT